MRNNIIIWVTLLAVIFFSNPASALEPSDLEFPCDILFPEADSFSELQGELPHYKVYEDKNDKEIAGICYVVSAPAFSANIAIMVGLNIDHTLAGIRVLQHREAITRMIGDFLREPFFYNQYKGKSINDDFRIGRDIDAVTRATVTNQVVARAVWDSSLQITQAYLPTIEVSQTQEEETYAEEAKGLDRTNFLAENNFIILFLLLASIVIGTVIIFRFQRKSMKLIFKNLNYFTIFTLTALVFIAMLSLGLEKRLTLILTSIITASLADLGINYFKNGKIFFPSTAIIIGLIIGLLLTPTLPLYIPVIVSFLAILSKHIIRVNNKPLFNPAGFGIMATLLLFPLTLSWWGGTSKVSLIVLGFFILIKLRKVQHIFAFFFAYVFLALIYTLITNQSFSFIMFEVFSGAFFFFVFLILTDPKTAPIKSKAKIFYGIIAAIAAFALFLVTPNGFIYGLLIANIFVPFLNKRF